MTLCFQLFLIYFITDKSLIHLPLQHHLLLDDNKYPHIVFVDKGDKINNHNETSTVAEAIKDELEGTITLMWFLYDIFV